MQERTPISIATSHVLIPERPDIPSNLWGKEERIISERARDGDSDAFASLWAIYQPKLFRYVLARTHDIHKAQDRTSEIVIRALEGIAKYEQRGVPFAAWLFRIARNHLISQHRREEVRSKSLTPLQLKDLSVPGDIDVELEAITNLEFGRLIEQLQYLTSAQRDVISLRFVAGLSVGETADVLGKKPTNVKVLQHKGLKRLRHLIGVSQAA